MAHAGLDPQLRSEAGRAGDQLQYQHRLVLGRDGQAMQQRGRLSDRAVRAYPAGAGGAGNGRQGSGFSLPGYSI